MRIEHENLRAAFVSGTGERRKGHLPGERIHPPLYRYDYLALHLLAQDLRALIERLPKSAVPARALDVGSAASPYRDWVHDRGMTLETIDLDPASGADHIGDAARTGLTGESYDLIICTQVLEHVPEPHQVMREIHRLLSPGGVLIASAPHVWFYHPHPGDYWRFTQEGVVELCRQTGFEVIELRAQGGSAVTLLQSFNFLVYGALGRAGAPLFALVNILGLFVDRLTANTLFSHNFAWLARRSG